MDGEALRFGESPHLLDQARLADARFAAHIDDLAAAPAEASADDALELLELGVAADERAAACAVRLAGEAAQAPDADGRIEPLELHLAERIAYATTAKGAMDAFGDQRLARRGGANEPRREVYRSPSTV